MLQYSTVEPHTLDILKKMMHVDDLKDFCLVGGTALSLLYGHRKSVDIDLFSVNEFNNEQIAASIGKAFSGFLYRNTHNPIGLFGSIAAFQILIPGRYRK